MSKQCNRNKFDTSLDNNFSTLASLVPGQSAIIKDIELPESLCRRLQELGLVKNTKVKCIGKSPLGDPMAFSVRGAVIAIRNSDSSNITCQCINNAATWAGTGQNTVTEAGALQNTVTEAGALQNAATWAGTGQNTVTCADTGQNTVTEAGALQNAATWAGALQSTPDKLVANATNSASSKNSKNSTKSTTSLTSSKTPQNSTANATSDKTPEVKAEKVKIVALAGNPNVGKSTLFNSLTGLRQHTGNWPGKTVTMATGYVRCPKATYQLVDLPGTYSLCPSSADEEVTRQFICEKNPDAIIVVCDATCLERNLILALHILRVAPNVIICINLLDEARRKGIVLDLSKLSDLLGVPVVGTVAKQRQTLDNLLLVLQELECHNSKTLESHNLEALEYENHETPEFHNKNNLERHNSKTPECHNHKNNDAMACPPLIEELIQEAENIAAIVTTYRRKNYQTFDRALDKFLAGGLFGYPIMFLLLLLVFWITIEGANYPSQLLSKILFGFQDILSSLMMSLGTPLWLHDMLILGLYRVMAWVVSVMLPPMAIFFPLFTLLEDAGYLPRVAYNLDKCFRACNTCGKQSLTMCMGFGCNAAGVIGCRIIDSPRERLIGILTNSFVPCNGRFPTLIALISIFFVGAGGGLLSALFLTAIILLGIVMTFLSSKLLSETLLKGVPSSIVFELPPYRKPKFSDVIIRSILDRTVFVLGRAILFAAPAGIIIWFLANTSIDGASLLSIISGFLDPFAKHLGLDGVILLAFILGLPANEIVLPIIIMCYLSAGYLTEFNDLESLKILLTENGWTSVTALCTMLFSLMHWPCSTTLLTIIKETGSIKWGILSILLPTSFGMTACFLVSHLSLLTR